jgi:hypothetical protein
VSVAVPYAWANVSLSTANRGVTPSKQGLADSYAHLTVGLVNTPALAPAEFGAYMQQNNPPVVVYGLMAVLPPTGDYQNDRLVNIGTNRWTFRAGLPTTVRLSPNWAPGKTTTFEILPSVDLYTPNNDPAFPEFSIRGRQVGSRLAKVLAPDQTTQAPMGTLEMHLTLDLNKRPGRPWAPRLVAAPGRRPASPSPAVPCWRATTTAPMAGNCVCSSSSPSERREEPHPSQSGTCPIMDGR